MSDILRHSVVFPGLKDEALPWDRVTVSVVIPAYNEIKTAVSRHLKNEFFTIEYGRIFDGDEFWQKLPDVQSVSYAWDDASNNRYIISGKGCAIQNPPSAWRRACIYAYSGESLSSVR